MLINIYLEIEKLMILDKSKNINSVLGIRFKKNNIKEIKERLSGWQLDSFNESYEHKKNNGISLFKKNLTKE